ncbi:hypothetical protein AWZ03_011944 [Drosophila navojoa]|uniref:Uncharacterized protein n=1 Tax=Drosophila navojoa TaxID=7232 RepID=A0A484AYW5_DRONA|nr:hypothetical protein AWZ03_011944 [Drosophila navojoa]
MAIFEPPKPKTCTDQPDLFTVRFNKMQKQYRLRFNKSLFMELFPSVINYACVFYEIVSGPSETPIWKKGSPFTCSDRIVPRSILGIVVECYELGNSSRVLQRDAFSFIQHPVGRNEANDEKRSRAYPSVIMLGIDSMSQMNFQRTMPLTAKFVRQLGWYEMLGYTSAGDNMLYNQIIFLTGRALPQWQDFCDMAKPGCLDAIIYLWNHFHNLGYLTAYAEDSPSLAFTRKPVDYYLFPILKVFKEIMEGDGRRPPDGSDYCLGRRESFRYVFESCLQLVQRFINETHKPLFGLFWTKSFSHEDFSAAARVDRDFVRYLELYREHGLFDKAVVVLFSLHGQRKGPLMGLASGFLEERLPMLHIYLPPWYRRQYPDVGQTLEVNRRRLTSTYDLHLTLKNLLVQVHPGIVFQREQIKAQSLFVKLAVNRSCEDAGISLYYCSCDLHMTVANNQRMTENVGPLTFGQNWIVPRHIEGIVMECFELRNRSRILQRDAFSFVQYPVGRNEQQDEQRSRTYPSVIMLGIDSMSQMNFQRTMPLTANFVRQLGWYEMLGYNKIGDNTLPNVMSLLTGLSSNQWRAQCNIHEPGCFDQFTYLWNHFQEAGYLTAYAEDTPSIDTFHYFTFGFIRKPVDYYLRPFMLMIQNTLNTIKHFGYEYCLGRRQGFRYVFDYCLQLVQRFVRDSPKPIFGIFWSNGFSHNDFRGPASVDRDFVSYLERYKEHGLFDKAVVILFSDHGQRQGALMSLASSFLEERLPMLHIYLPPWFREQHPEFVQALDWNRHRLSSTFDLHLTLKHLLLLQGQSSLQFNSFCAKCQSLFEPLPVNRSCEDAAIPEHWCTCDSYVQVRISNVLIYWAKTIVYRINEYLASRNYAAKCVRLKLAKLLRAERKQIFDDDGNPVLSPQSIQTYRIKFVTRPNGGLFRATFLTDSQNHVMVQEEFITRLNSYRNESFCVSEHVAQKFCACFEASRTFSIDIINVNDQGTPC